MFWLWFNLALGVLLLLDLFVFNRRARSLSMKEGLLWTLFWIFLSLCFNVFVYFDRGPTAALQFFTGYLIEKSLSIDNLFVMTVIFSFFKVPSKYQHKVLYWGILGALVMRLLFILGGLALIERFHFVIYLLGAFLIFTGYKLFFQKESKLDVEDNFLVKLSTRFIPMTRTYHEGAFFIKKAGKWLATPLFLVLLVIEYTDVIFAIDSIPAIFAITTDPFIVYTSNVCAILGLRSLYFVLSGSLERFRHLKKGIALILIFIGLKMLLSFFLAIPIFVSLLIVLIILITSLFTR